VKEKKEDDELQRKTIWEARCLPLESFFVIRIKNKAGRRSE
jgi:hypothetical protein